MLRQVEQILRQILFMSNIWVYVISHVRLAGQPSCVAKTLILDNTCRLLPNSFVPAMLIGTIDFCHFIPLSVTVTLAGGHMVSTELNLLTSFSHAFFHFIKINLIKC